MTRYLAAFLALLAVVSMPVARAANWVEGKNYFPIASKRGTNVPAGTVEVMEVFSYGCPACNQFVPIANKLKASLPANAKMVFLPAAFNPAEDWPMFQRAYFAAQALGIADKTHDAMFDAVWKPGGALAIMDESTHQLRRPLPTIEDAGRWYNKRTGVAVDKFVSTAKSFGVDVKMKAADEMIGAYQVDRTPTIIVNGKYRLHAESAGGYDQLIELVKYLVAKESAAK
jgi:protein dithiol oxidoreductase (disulfide-forming)